MPLARCWVVPVLVALAASSSVPASGRAAQGDGVIHGFDVDRFKRLGTIASGEAGDEFGTRASGSFVATAPAAAGGGRIFLVSDGGIEQSMSAADLSSIPTSRLGESWGDLGHPPGTESALVFGAPGEPDDGSARMAAKPSVVMVEYRTSTQSQQYTREVGRVTGPSGSLFGWRVRATDSQFPAASFNASYIVTAPHLNRGKKAKVGAVYKIDTETGRQVWKFRGRVAGGMIGYDLLVVPDADGDGVADLLVGAPGTRDRDPAGRVYLLSGRKGKVLQVLEAPEDAVLFGYALRTGASAFAFDGIIISAPATPNGKKAEVGAVYVYPDLDGSPEVLRGRRPTQWFGISLALSVEHLFVGSFEGSRRASKDMRGSVTVLLPSGKIAKLLRGKKGGDYFGRSISRGATLAIGAPAAPPLIVPE